jgi:membrane protein YdbS with pleckstrin-like domain
MPSGFSSKTSSAIFLICPVIVVVAIYRFISFVTCLLTITANVLALGAVADFGAQNCQYTTKVDTG